MRDPASPHALKARLALALTTRRFRPDARLPPDLLDTIRVLEVQGWRLRAAGPRTLALWRADPSLQGRLRAVVLPDGRARLTLRDWDALLRHRLAPLAPRLERADPTDLLRAGARLLARDCPAPRVATGFQARAGADWRLPLRT